MYRTLLAASAAFWVAGQANASTVIDFEDFGNTYMTGGGSGVCAGQGDDACTIVGDEFTGDGITLSFVDVVPQLDDAIRIIRVGNPLDGFVPKDTPKPDGVFGDFFLTTEFKKNTHFSLTFNERSDVSFGIADIDGPGSVQDQSAGDLEYFTLKAFLGSGGTTSVTVAGDGTVIGDAALTDGVAGDALVTGFSFIDVTRIEVLATTFDGNRNIGWGIDNIAFEDNVNAVPLPAGVWLLGTAFAGLGIARRRRKAS